MRFPTVTGSSLAGRRFELPADFEGELNLAVLAYQQWHQPAVDTWGPLLAILARRHPSFRAYELPTMERFGRLQRLMIDGGMRLGIADRAVRARTITLYLDVARFNAALGLPGADTIHALLVSRQGEVLWRASGDYTAEKGESLTYRVAELLERRAAA